MTSGRLLFCSTLPRASSWRILPQNKVWYNKACSGRIYRTSINRKKLRERQGNSAHNIGESQL